VRFTMPLINTQLDIDVQFPAAVTAFRFPRLIQTGYVHHAPQSVKRQEHLTHQCRLLPLTRQGGVMQRTFSEVTTRIHSSLRRQAAQRSPLFCRTVSRGTCVKDQDIAGYITFLLALFQEGAGNTKVFLPRRDWRHILVPNTMFCSVS